MSRPAAPLRRLRRLVRARARRPHPDVVRLSPEDRRILSSFHDDRVPLPPGAAEELREESPRLRELREAYARCGMPAEAPSRWRREAIDGFLDLRWFRGDTLLTWHYRELPRVTALKYFVWARHVRDRDESGFLDSLEEDGAFGCWTFAYPGYGRVSRDLLESVAELNFLERALGLAARERFSVLDVGAGYGRLAHRMTSAYPNLEDFCCVDAVPESTFLSDYYLRFREAGPRARVVRLDAIEAELRAGSFDLAVNVHSFSECTHGAIAWWAALLARLRVPRLLVVPNEPTELLSLEPDGSRRDFGPVLEAAGYRLERREPVVDDPAVRELLPLDDHFHLFAREE